MEGGGQNWAVHSTSGRADRSKVGGWTWGWQSRGSAGRRQGERGACAQGRRGLQWRTRHSKIGAGHETHTRQGKSSYERKMAEQRAMPGKRQG